MDGVSIEAHHIAKMYRLYRDPASRLKEALWRGRRSYHQEFWALRDVSFSVPKGSTVGVIGRNGSGKSTLLQLIAGIVPPSSGSIRVDGRVSALLELGSGFDPEFTGRENVYMNGAILGLSRREMDTRFAAIESFAAIGEFIDQPVKLYSSGMFVRLAFAVAINVDPDVLLVDEALAVGDVVFQHRCMSRIREIQRQGKTIFFVSHDIGAVQKLCTTVILLDHGRVLRMGEPEDVVREYYRIIWNAERENGGNDHERGEDETRGLETVSELVFEEITHYDQRFGNRTGEIVACALVDEQGLGRDTFRGGERVVFSLRVKCHQAIEMPMAGFVIKDLLGHELIKTNTDVEGTSLHPCAKGSVVHVTFSFALPNLRAGSYAISAGFGNGTLDHHTAYDWIENLRVFTVETDRDCYGLVWSQVEVEQK